MPFEPEPQLNVTKTTPTYVVWVGLVIFLSFGAQPYLQAHALFSITCNIDIMLEQA